YKQSGAGEHEIVTQWDGPTCERMGLLKMDFLGLRTISVVERCKTLIREGLEEREVWGAVGREGEYEQVSRCGGEQVNGAGKDSGSPAYLLTSYSAHIPNSMDLD